MLIVAALGGNALLCRGEPMRPSTQARNVHSAVAALAPLAHDHDLVVTHGNGPQVGLLALQDDGEERFPLDVLDAETQGMIGYLIEHELMNALPGRDVVTLLTRVVVAADDPGFSHPTKPIGPVYERAEAERLAALNGWTIAPDGPHFRRVVASPEPLGIVELGPIRRLLDAGIVVVCTGGGGIPVVREAGRLRGIEAVIDKDRASAVLAESLGADLLLLLTDVPAVVDGWGGEAAEPLGRVDTAALRGLAFEPGSMAPKVEASCRFVDRTGGRAAIGQLTDASALVAGERGTQIVPAGSPNGECVTDRMAAAATEATMPT
jgi:carbamate kinase